MASVNNVVVVGGGIAGLTLAAALRRAGIGVRIIEKGDRANRLGTGISLLGNALRALDMIGLADRCIEAGFGFDKVVSRDHAGNVVAEIPMARTFRPDRPGSFGIMRPKLAEILEEVAVGRGATIDFQTSLTDFDQDDTGVHITLSSGERFSADLLVGADGAYSALRTALFGQVHIPKYCGQSCLRYTAARPEGMDGITFYRSPQGYAIGAIPLSQDHCYYFILENDERRSFQSSADLVALWKERVAGFTAPDLIAATEAVSETSPLSYRPLDVLMLPGPWHKGRVLLIGDAAHSLSPQLTSGGGMAIEDAVVLARTLVQGQDLEADLRTFEEQRVARVQPILETSLEICINEQNPSAATQGKNMQLMSKGYALLEGAF